MSITKPESWEEAEAWESVANKSNSTWDMHGPRWRFDCGFKLDYDGGIIQINSRFYPCRYTNGDFAWDGHISVYVLKCRIGDKHIKAANLKELRGKSEEYMNSIASAIHGVIKKSGGLIKFLKQVKP